jgi:FtsP/CotA-like multicopper oxidase with cupredoxin domain
MKLAPRMLLPAALTALLVPCALAQSNSIPCGDGITGAPLQRVPEIVRTDDGVLRGTLYTVSEQQRFPDTIAGKTPSPTCYPQWVRAYRRDPPASWNPSSQAPLVNPMPGPTLRGRVGDVVELTFLNMIDANKFPGVDDNQCDQSTVYPGTGANADTYPDCFAGSVFTNVHFHGTHVNPNSTGDNVFLQIRPSPRKTDGTNEPIVTAGSVAKSFDEFFAACRQQLQSDPGPKIWPTNWSELPAEYTTSQQDLLKRYAPDWYAANERLRAQGNWPQYYVAAYPYCYRIPAYVSTQPVRTNNAEVRTPHTHGAGSAEVNEAEQPNRPLIMGQAPGTHWYHAHKHGSTTINVSNGMTGVFIIEGEYDDDINKVYGKDWTRTQPVLVLNQLGSIPALVSGQKGAGPGPDFAVNGQIRPVLKMKGNEVQMWRIANTSSRAGAYFLAPTGLQWMQLAQDGVQFKDSNYLQTKNIDFLLASGNRADLLVKAPKYNASGNNTYDVYVYNTVDPSDRPPQKEPVAKLTLLQVQVEPDGPDMQFLEHAPAFPPFLEDVTDAEVTGTKVLTFASTSLGNGFPSQHTIDGKKFDGELGAVVALNRAEEWKIVNETFGPATGNQIAHPFHIHVNPFQITEKFDPNAAISSTKGSGTVTTTANVLTVTGTGTSFTKQVHVGDFIWIEGLAPATVVSVASDTSLTLETGYGTKAIKDAPYRIALPLYTIDKAGARSGQCVLDPKVPATWRPCTQTEPAVNRIWWDVFPIPSGNIFTAADGTQYPIPGYFKMRSRFVDYAGYFVLHCHILAHEDRGMMTVVEVAPLQTPYSHH